MKAKVSRLLNNVETRREGERKGKKRRFMGKDFLLLLFYILKKKKINLGWAKAVGHLYCIVSRATLRNHALVICRSHRPHEISRCYGACRLPLLSNDDVRRVLPILAPLLSR